MKPLAKWRQPLLLAALFVTVPSVMIRASPGNLDSTVPFNQGDPSLILWTLRVSAHNARHPSRLFDAPIFAPHHDTLAYADPLLAPAPIQRFLEVVTPGGSLVAYNVLLYLMFVFNLITMYFLAKRVLGRSDGAIFAALAFTFSAMAMSWLGHPQLLPIGFFALAFHLLLRLLDEQRIHLGIACAIVFAATVSTSLYHGAILSACVGTIAVCWLAVNRRRVRRGTWTCLAVFAVTAGVLTFPIARPYMRVRDEFKFSRPLSPEWGLNPRDVLTPLPGATVSSWLSDFGARATSEHTYFPGLTTIALAIVGMTLLVAWGVRRLRRSTLESVAPGIARPTELALLVIAGMVSFILSLGPTVLGLPMPFRLVHRIVPGFDGIRVASRLAAPAFVAGTVLAGAGLSALTHRLGQHRGRRVTVAFCIVALVELAAPIPRSQVDQSDATTAVYRELASRPSGAVVELPMADLRKSGADWAFVETPRMLLATIDWKPRVNGYSGYFPPTYPGDLDTFATFPSVAALARAREIGVRYAIVHVALTKSAAAYDETEARAIISALPDGATANQFGNAWLVDLGNA